MDIEEEENLQSREGRSMKGRELRGGRKSINVAIGSSQPLTGC